MAEFIVNPRRVPRAPARCRTHVTSAAGAFDSETEDIGANGCQVIVPRLVRKGDAVELTIGNERVPESLRIRGRVAWVSPQAPWRAGIAFDDPSLRESARWFEKLVASYPGLRELRRVPQRIPADAMVYLGAPPRFLLDFTADEASLLRAIASGARIDELQARLRDRWPGAQRALFSLLARQAVTLTRGQAVHPDAWKRILSEVEASLAVESLGRGGDGVAAPPLPVATPVPRPSQAPAAVAPPPRAVPPPAARAVPPAPRPAAPPPRASPTPAPGAYAATWNDQPSASRWDPGPIQDPHPMLELADDEPPLEIDTARAAGERAPTPVPHRGPVATPISAHADFAGAGVGWRAKAPRIRTPEASATFERARAELSAGNVNGAIALLRRALALAPGDPEIADALGKLAFKDRLPRT